MCANVLSLKVVFPIPHKLTLFSYYNRKHVYVCNYATLFYSKNACTPPPLHTYTHTQMDASTMAVSARPLSYDAVFRIEVSLSSRKSSAIVMRTTARLYTLEGTPSMMGGTGSRLHSGVSQPYCPICQAFHPLPLPTAWGHNNASQTQPTTVWLLWVQM